MYMLNAICRDFPPRRYIPSFVWLFAVTRLLSLGHVVQAIPIQPIQNAFFLMIVIKKSRDTWGRTTLGIPVWEQSLVFYLHEPVSSLFSIWHIILIQFQLHLSNHFLMIHLQHRQYNQAKEKSRKGAELPQRSPGMLELRNVLNIKEYCKNWGRKRLEKIFSTPPPPLSQKYFLERFFPKKRPPPPPIHFTEKYLLTGKYFEVGNTLFVTGIFGDADKEFSLTICPRHREMYGTRWLCNKKTCSVPLEWSSHKRTKPKGDRGITFAQSKHLYNLTKFLVPVGSREYCKFYTTFIPQNLSTMVYRWLSVSRILPRCIFSWLTVLSLKIIKGNNISFFLF
jgi:hypothetical protein